MKATLREYGVSEKQATVHSFGAPFELGPKGKLVHAARCPPRPARGSILVSGEEGRVEVLCYPHEVARLRARVLPRRTGSTRRRTPRRSTHWGSGAVRAL